MQARGGESRGSSHPGGDPSAVPLWRRKPELQEKEAVSESVWWEQQVREECAGVRGITACCDPGGLFSEGWHPGSAVAAKGGNHKCQTLPRPQGPVCVVVRQGTAGLAQIGLPEPSSNLQPSRGGAVLGRTVVRAGTVSLWVRTSCPSPDPELPACLQRACM